MKLDRLAIVVGHTPQTGGAVAADGSTEYELMSGFADLLLAHVAGTAQTKVYRHGYAGSYWRTVHPTIKAINDWGADLMIELHFNSVGREHPGYHQGGCIHYGNGDTGAESAKGRAWGSALAGAVEVLDVESWGSKPMDRSWNAPPNRPPRRSSIGRLLPNGPELYMLTRTRCPAILMEAFNGRNPGHVSAFLDRRATFARALSYRLSATRTA